jgi:hypothetical protein
VLGLPDAAVHAADVEDVGIGGVRGDRLDGTCRERRIEVVRRGMILGIDGRRALEVPIRSPRDRKPEELGRQEIVETRLLGDDRLRDRIRREQEPRLDGLEGELPARGAPGPAPA